MLVTHVPGTLLAPPAPVVLDGLLTVPVTVLRGVGHADYITVMTVKCQPGNSTGATVM